MEGNALIAYHVALVYMRLSYCDVKNDDSETYVLRYSIVQSEFQPVG